MLTVDEKFEDRYVCVLGLGYVGLTLAAVMADVGFKVLGVEVKENVVESLKKGEPHFFEPGLKDLITRLVHEQRIKFVTQMPENSRATVYIITVGTPLDAKGKANMEMVSNASREVAEHLKKGDMVILRSTLKVGTTRQVVLPILQKTGLEFDLAFCPERTLEGQALAELRQLPQIVGAATFDAAVRAAQIFQFLTPTVIRVNDPETAEIIKLTDNAFRDVTFAYANEVAEICSTLGVNAIEVIRAGKLGYTRTNLPIPGLVGGPCLEKDPYILAECTKEKGFNPVMTLAARQINEQQPIGIIDYVAKLVKKMDGFPEKPEILLLGLAFKGRPATDDLRGTLAKPILKALKAQFPSSNFRGYDPVVSQSAMQDFGVKPFATLEDAFHGAHLAFILNNHPSFSQMPISVLTKSMARPALVYDFWNSFSVSSLNFPKGVGYMAIGSHGQAILPNR